MNAYKVIFKESKESRKVFTWTRFAETIDAARQSAEGALDYEFSGKAVLVSIVPIPDPRCPVIPMGLRRDTYEECSINFNPCTGLRWAYDLQAEGLVTVRWLRGHWQQYNKMCQTEYWQHYEISPTQLGIELLDAHDRFWQDAAQSQ